MGVHTQKNSMTLQQQHHKYTLARHHRKTHKPAVYLSCSDVKGLINSFNLELNVLTLSAGWPLLHINPVHQGTLQTPKIYTHTHTQHPSPGWAEGLISCHFHKHQQLLVLLDFYAFYWITWHLLLLDLHWHEVHFKVWLVSMD